MLFMMRKSMIIGEAHRMRENFNTICKYTCVRNVDVYLFDDLQGDLEPLRYFECGPRPLIVSNATIYVSSQWSNPWRSSCTIIPGIFDDGSFVVSIDNIYQTNTITIYLIHERLKVNEIRLIYELIEALYEKLCWMNSVCDIKGIHDPITITQDVASKLQKRDEFSALRFVIP